MIVELESYSESWWQTPLWFGSSSSRETDREMRKRTWSRMSFSRDCVDWYELPKWLNCHRIKLWLYILAVWNLNVEGARRERHVTDGNWKRKKSNWNWVFISFLFLLLGKGENLLGNKSLFLEANLTFIPKFFQGKYYSVNFLNSSYRKQKSLSWK